ncbi:MAG TPA: nickel insertion protein, partial [Candidatus Sulfotelmatobacter sp.]|nr:nickel insertion protein [Candidatus Sulfotelmatobacter sp.]
MKIAYFDCPSGLSGNMILGALLDSGLDADYLINEIGNLRLNLSQTVPVGTGRDVAVTNLRRGNRDVPSQVSEPDKLIIEKTKRRGFSGTYFNVILKKRDRHRSLKDILAIISRSKLSKNVKQASS